MPTKKNKRTIDASIQEKALGVLTNNISQMLQSLDKIDTQRGILVWFYFLAFVEIANQMKDTNKQLFIIYIIIFGVACWYLLKGFWLSQIKNLYPSIKGYFDGTENPTEYKQDIFDQYTLIKNDLKQEIANRREDIRMSIIWLCVSLWIFVISILTCNSHNIPHLFY